MITTTRKSNILVLRAKIESWFINAKIDYDVNGRLVSIDQNTEWDSIEVKIIEDGTESSCTIEGVSFYTGLELYNIWMEKL